MRERTKELVSLLEHDPSNTEVISRLEELVSEDGVEEHISEIKSELHEGMLRLQNSGRYKAANALIELELVLTDDTADEVALLILQATILDEDLFDQSAAIVSLERALKLDDTLEDVEEKIELMKAERERYEEIAKTFKEQAESATDNSLKAHMLYSAAERLYKNDPQNIDIEPLLKDAMTADPLHHKAARLYERILEDSSNWTELADLYENLAKTRKGKRERISMYLAAGYTYGFRLEDVDSAALCYAEVLDYEPGHKKALHFLVDYYEKKEDWDSLVALYEDTLHGKLKPEDEIAACMQIGMVHWRFREDLESAEKYFKRLSKLAPAHPGMIEFYRKYCAAKNDNLLLLRVFENAVRFSDDPDFKEPLTREIAKLSASDGGNVEKAIDAWKKVLRKDKGNREAIDELLRLYRQAGKWNNLIELLKSEADELDDSQVDDKIALYNEMVEIYRDELSLEMMVIKVYNTILALDPDNIDAIEKLQDAYEESGRWNDLIKVLSRRIEIVEDDEIKVSLLNKIASLWIDKFNNFNKAVEPLEAIIELKADDIKAITALKEIYEKRRAWKPLQDLLKKELELADEDSKADILEQMAVLTAEKLNERQEAIAIWWSVYEANPQNDNALDNIEKLAEREKDWDALGKVLRTLIDNAAENEKVALLTKLGTVYKDRVKDPVKAAEVWKELLDVEPGNSKAMRSLKEAYQESEDWDALEKLFSGAGDYESLVEVLGIAADRVKDDETKKMLSFRCADIYNRQIGQPDRAVRHYERVLTVEPDNKDAANALVPIYKNTEKWSRLSGVLEVVLESTEDKDERFLLIDELRELAVDKLNNREQAYRWAARAFAEMPNDESVMQTLEESAEQAHAFDRLVDLYKQNIEQFDGADRAKLESHIASLSLEKLGNVEDAIKQYKEVLEENQEDETALLALDSIYRTTSQWDELENIFTLRIAKAADNEEKKNLIMDMASMYEDGMDNPEKAAENYRALLSESPDDIEVLNSLERIYQLLEKFEELASVIEAQKDLLAQGDEDWVEKTFQLARIYRNNLENKQRAIELYQEILDSGSGRDESIEALDEFLRDEKFQFNVAKILQPFLKENEDWRRLAWVLSILIENTPMGIERIELNVRLADLYGEKLNDERLSFETLGNTIKEAPNEMDLWDKLLTLSHRLDALDDGGQYLTDAYNNESIEESTRLELAKKLAELYGNEIGDQEKAEPFHEYILNESPDAVESFNALDQYYTAMEKWDELLLLFYNAKEKDAYTGGLLELQLKICFVLYEIQHDVENSIEAYKEVLEMDGENDEAYRALVSLYEEAGKWKDLSELYLDHLQRVDEQEAISLQYKIGEIAEKRLGNFEDAMDYYQLVIQRDPDNLKTQEAFERLLEKSEMRQRAAEILAENYEQ
ncbi:MAG: tetratricopeptide repeat protein, partial [Deltaproteobacteria bacterium]|nr:tetratricopeptide repeat protein [Deltaproteobacteria bacterium]